MTSIAENGNTNAGKFVTAIMTLVIGITNFTYHSITDWYLGILTGKIKGINLESELLFRPEKYDILLPNSFYLSGTSEVLLLWILLILTSGYSTWKFIKTLIHKKRPTTGQYLLMVLLWIIKIPVVIQYSGFHGWSIAMFYW